MMRDGYVVTWRGREYDAAPDGDQARIYSPEPGEGFDELASGTKGVTRDSSEPLMVGVRECARDSRNHHK